MGFFRVVAAFVIFSLGICTAFAQSLGDIVRQTRSVAHPRAKKVYTNDDIPSVDTMRGAASSSDSTKNDEDEGKSDAGKAGSAPKAADRDTQRKQQESDWNAKIARQREKISLLQRELDVTEREHQQKELAHYSDINARITNSPKWVESQKAYEEELADKKQKLNAERETLSAMEEDARHSGVKIPD